MESINKKIVLLSLVMALTATVLAYFYIKSNTGTGKKVEKTIKVYVAKEDILPNKEIKSSDLEVKDSAEEYINENAVTKIGDIVGRRAKEKILKGEQILKERLLDGNVITASYKVPVGKRAVSFNVSEQGQIAALLKQGDKVDFIVSFDKDEVEIAGVKKAFTKFTRILLENLEVLSVGQSMIKSDEKSSSDVQKTVTLAIDYKDVEKAVFCSDFGIIRLSLRNIDDDTLKATDGAIRDDVSISKSKN